MSSIADKIYEIGIVPVITFNSMDQVLPLCKALWDGGLSAVEVTFRSGCAEECLRQIHREMPEMLLGAGTILTPDQADRAIAAGASFVVTPGFDPAVIRHVMEKGCMVIPGTSTAGEMQQAINLGCEVLKFFPAEANGGVAMLKEIGAALKTAKWICTGGISAQNLKEYLACDQVIAVGGTWMCRNDLIEAGAWDQITALCRKAVDTMLGLRLAHIGINTASEEEAKATASLLAGLLNLKMTPGAANIFVGNREFEILKKPGRGKNGHIAIGCSNVDRAIYHLSRRGVQFDLDSKIVRGGQTAVCYMTDEIAGFALHLGKA